MKKENYIIYLCIVQSYVKNYKEKSFITLPHKTKEAKQGYGQGMNGKNKF